jgi:ABC-type glycerol-3-phosphate transport system substrate-binding protein
MKGEIMKSMKVLVRTSAAFTVLALSACGGGGGSHDGDTPLVVTHRWSPTRGSNLR